MVKATTKVVYPPMRVQRDLTKVDVFLAGSIEMGKASDWQTMLGFILSQEDAVGRVFNPRRKDWDNSWEQSPQNAHFNEQVNWELDHIEQSDIVFVNFVPGTMSPVTLAELGFLLGRHKFPIVCCPKDFWRSGNVQIMCERESVLCFENYEQSVEVLIECIRFEHAKKVGG